MDPSPTPVTVVVLGPADRTASIAAALGDDGIDVVGTADAGAAEEEMRNEAPDIIVAVADSATLAATGRVCARALATRVVSVGTTDPALLADGNVGTVVDDEHDSAELRAAVLGLALGEARLDAAFAAYIVAELRDSSGHESLSSTEDEVLTRLAAGDPVDALAEAYAVSPRLVRLVTGGAVARLLSR